MKNWRRDATKTLWIAPAAVVILWLLAFSGPLATGDPGDFPGDLLGREVGPKLLAKIDGFGQVPPVHTEGTGLFKGKINRDGTITYTLTYSGLTPFSSPHLVQFADVHFGQKQNTGGILFFLCSNQATAPTQANPVSTSATGTDTFGVPRTGTQTLFNGPVAVPGFGTSLPACPNSGSVTGTIGPADIVDVGAPGKRGAQGIGPTELEKALEAIRSGQTYVQVHTNAFPAGELRGQID